MRVRHADRGDAVVLLDRGALAPLASAPLQGVTLQVLTFQEAVLREHHDDVALGDQLLVRGLPVVVDDLRPAVVPEPPAQVPQLVPDHAVQDPGVAQDLPVGGDIPQQLAQLLVQLLALQAGQALKAHLQYGLSLELREPELADQPLLGLRRRGRGADELDDLVDDVERLDQALDDMLPRQSLVQAELRPAPHHAPAVVQEQAQNFRYGQFAGASLVECQVDHAERGLELCPPVELAHHQVGIAVPGQVQNDAHSLTVRLVADIRDAVDLLVLDAGDHRLDQVGLVDHEGDLGHHDAGAAALALLRVDAPPDDDASPSRPVGVIDALASQNQPPGREVRTGHALQDVRQPHLFGGFSRLQNPAEDVHDLPQVVGGDVRRHAHRDARAAVDQQVRQHRGQVQGLLERLVEVRAPVHGLLVDIGQHQLARLVEPRLRVAHGRRAVPVDGAEVSLPVHQTVAQAPVLRHADHRVVYGAVPVGVIFTHRLADDAGGLLVRRVVPKPQLRHGVQDAPLHGLQAVADIGQRPPHDDAHGVVQVALLDLVHQGQGDDPAEQRAFLVLFRH